MQHLRLATALLPLLLLAACGSKPSPVGTWNLDAEAMVLKMLGIEDASKATDQQKAQLEMAKSVKGSLEFKADNTFTVTMAMGPMGEQKVSGTWKLEGDKLSMTGKEAGSDKEETKTATFTADKIVVEDTGPDGKPMSMTFHKAAGGNG